MYVKTNDPEIKRIAKLAFPDYRGRKFRYDTRIPTKLESYWSEGSRDSYAFVELKTGKVAAVQSNHPFFEAGRPSELKALPAGFVIVEHSIFCGKDMCLTVYVNACDIWPALTKGE